MLNSGFTGHILTKNRYFILPKFNSDSFLAAEFAVGVPTDLPYQVGRQQVNVGVGENELGVRNECVPGFRVELPDQVRFGRKGNGLELLHE